MTSSTSRPRTPSASTASPNDKLAAIPEAGKEQPRRSSFGLLLRRSKSTELKPKGSKKQQAAFREQELERQRREAAVPRSPPRLPDLYNGAASPELPFGGEERQDSIATVSGKGYGRGSMEQGRIAAANGNIPPVPPIPSNGTRNGDWVDPYARTESMTHRGRYSYASSAVSTINSPRRVRRRKDPTPFK